MANSVRQVANVLLCAAALAGVPAAAVADSLVGPQLGNVTYRGEIRIGPDGDDDDAFAGHLLRGERLSLRIVSPFQSPLFPEIVVVGPDGTPRDVGVRSRGNFGKVLELRNWVVPETGLWTVHVRSQLATQGDYTLRMSIRSRSPERIVVPRDKTGTVPADVDFAFDAIEGARLELRATSRDRTAPQIVALTDPAGATVRDEDSVPVVGAAIARKGRVTLGVEALASGDGTYHAQITAPAGHRGFEATARVIPPARPRGSRRLGPDEPWIAPRLGLLRGVKERTVRIDGRNFSKLVRPVVLFGNAKGTDVSVDPFGNYLDVKPPQLAEGATVRVAVVNPDGQAAERPAFFFYVPTPRVEDITDVTGAAVRGSSTAGGRKVRFKGTGFETGVYVRFGGSQDVLPQILDSGEMELRTPAQPAGTVEIHLLDGFLHDEVVQIAFEYKAPPAIDSPAYTPEIGVSLGSVDIAGTGFEPTDVVLFDGSPAVTQWLSPFGLRFFVPVATSGQHAVSVIDRIGTVTACPNLTVQ